MHIPDNFLSTPVWTTMDVVAAGAVAVAVRKVNRRIQPESIPYLGVAAAMIFAAQMINVQFMPGASCHLLGGVLAAVLLGPAEATLVMAVVILGQALLFSDGGITALGANIFNMGVIGTVVGYSIYVGLNRLLTRCSWGRFAALFLSAWSAAVLGALAASIELVVSGVWLVRLQLPVMVGVHALSGIVEGVLTCVAFAYVAGRSPVALPGVAEEVTP